MKSGTPSAGCELGSVAKITGVKNPTITGPARVFESEEELVLNLGNFLFEFNHLRAHGGLEYKTPFDKLVSVTELLS
jgi:hypothetical protein